MREVCEAAVDKEKEAAPLSAPAAVCSPQCTPALRQCPHLCAPRTAAPLCSPHSRTSVLPPALLRAVAAQFQSHAPWLDTRGHIGTRPPAIQRRIRSLRIENTCLGLSGKRDIVIALLLTLHLLVVAGCCVRICTDFPWIDAARHLNRWIPLLSTSSVCAMSCHVV